MTDGKLIGPINVDITSWRTMRALRESIKWAKETDPVRFSSCIEKETRIYKDFLSNYLEGKNL